MRASRRSACADERPTSTDIVDGDGGIVGHAALQERARLPRLLPHVATAGRHVQLAERRDRPVRGHRDRRTGAECALRLPSASQGRRQSLRKLLRRR